MERSCADDGSIAPKIKTRVINNRFILAPFSGPNKSSFVPGSTLCILFSEPRRFAQKNVPAFMPVPHRPASRAAILPRLTVDFYSCVRTLGAGYLSGSKYLHSFRFMPPLVAFMLMITARKPWQATAEGAGFRRQDEITASNSKILFGDLVYLNASASGSIELAGHGLGLRIH